VDNSTNIAESVRTAYETGTPLQLCGSGSKAFLTDTVAGTPLDVSTHRGIIDYEPSELVLTARAGTPLAEIEHLLAANGQMLACEPPHFGQNATLGGTVACGLSGPRRPFAGSLRDCVLGVRLVNGKGEHLRFGGQVMKNVAGFDVSRLMVGAQGTLGVLLDISLKVLPRPGEETTLRVACDERNALDLFADWAAKPLPISAAAWHEGWLMARFSGSHAAVQTTSQRVMGELLGDASAFWADLREQALPFFHLAPDESLWRIAVPPGAPPLELAGRTCIDWGGALRWLVSSLPSAQIFEAAQRAGGHATLFRSAAEAGVRRLSPPPALAALQRNIRQAFDPVGIFNPGVFQEMH
jgi:glycolate oxidase FAD binding subunit